MKLTNPFNKLPRISNPILQRANPQAMRANADATPLKGPSAAEVRKAMMDTALRDPGVSAQVLRNVERNHAGRLPPPPPLITPGTYLKDRLDSIPRDESTFSKLGGAPDKLPPPFTSMREAKAEFSRGIKSISSPDPRIAKGHIESPVDGLSPEMVKARMEKAAHADPGISPHVLKNVERNNRGMHPVATTFTAGPYIKDRPDTIPHDVDTHTRLGGNSTGSVAYPTPPERGPGTASDRLTAARNTYESTKLAMQSNPGDKSVKGAHYEARRELKQREFVFRNIHGTELPSTARPGNSRPEKHVSFDVDRNTIMQVPGRNEKPLPQPPPAIPISTHPVLGAAMPLHDSAHLHSGQNFTDPAPPSTRPATAPRGPRPMPTSPRQEGVGPLSFPDQEALQARLDRLRNIG